MVDLRTLSQVEPLKASRPNRPYRSRPSLLLLGVLCCACTIVGPRQSRAQCDYDVTPIEPVPCGIAIVIRPTDLSNAGHVVGWYDDCSLQISFDVAFVWTLEAGRVDIPLPAGTDEAQALAVNSAGRVVGKACPEGCGVDIVAGTLGSGPSSDSSLGWTYAEE